MPKYDPLGKFLAGLDRDRPHTPSFERIEKIIGFRLPDSARRHQAWWANEKAGRHVQASQWLDAGMPTEEVSLSRQQITFRPTTVPRELRAVRKAGLTIPEAKRGLAQRYGLRPDQVEIVLKG